ncbi:DUF6049 family protein [Brevibacterium litoralis]|uniref:DUF6049 family protein n=1 Tax=Brevibacterium litoralis TaxID=3138935 RepID=UPI0032EF0ED1
MRESRSPSTRLSRLVAGPAVLAALTFGCLTASPVTPAAGTEVTSSAEAPATPDSPVLTLDTVSPWVGPEDTLTVSGTLTNPSDTDVTDPRMALTLSADRLTDRRAIEDWKADTTAAVRLADTADPPDPRGSGDTEGEGPEDAGVAATDGPDAIIEVPDLPEVLGPGQTVDVEFTVPAADLGLTGGSAFSTWGARGLDVRFSGMQGDTQVATHRIAYTTWWPEPTVDPTRLTFVLPVVLAGGDPTGLVPADRLEEATGPEGELTHLFEVAESDPDTALAVDPRLLASVTRVLEEDGAPSAEDPADAETTGPDDPADGDTGETEPADRTTPEDEEDGEGATAGGTAEPLPGPSVTGDPEQATDLPTPTAAEDPHPRLRAWYQDFVAVGQDRTVLALPWADTDPSLLRAAGLGPTAERAEDGTDLVAQVFPEARTDVAWPADGTATIESMEDRTATGADTFLLTDAQKPSLTGYTTNALSSLSFVSGGTTEAFEERPETTTATALVADQGLTDTLARTDTDPAVVAGEFLAETAAITLERPYDSRELLVTHPRATTADTARTAAAVAGAFEDTPWVEGLDLAGLTEGQPVARSPLVVDPTRGTAVTDLLAGTDAVRSRAAEFSAAYVDPESFLTVTDHMLLTCTSVAILDTALDATRPGLVTDCTDEAAAVVDATRSGIAPEQGSDVLLVTGEEITIPVIVQNTTGADARLRVRIAAETPGLQTTVSPAAVVPAGSSYRFEVPVSGVANGNVATRVELLTDADTALPESTDLLVRVRAEWENIGTAVVGSLLVIVFVAGVVVSIRKGRRTIPQNQLDAAVARAEEN